jgi:DNA-binding NarL/FixJ family response regulator
MSNDAGNLATGLPLSGPAHPATSQDVSATRIAFVDDHPTLLRGMASLFASDDRYTIVGTGSSADDAVELAVEHSPDVLIVDLSMPGDIFAAVASIAEQAPQTKILVFTAYADVDKALRVIDAGAHAFVLKGRPSEDLYEAIDAIGSGELYISPGFSQHVMTGFRNRTRREKELSAARLSAREQQIVKCLLEAKTNKEIARTLGLSEKTVKHYMTNLMTKLKVKSRLEVVLAAQAMMR